MEYTEAMQYLLQMLPVYHRVGAPALRPGLGNITRLCNWLVDPQLQYKTIHIAGTNGKGSTSHMLAAMLQAAGYKVGLLTSPHLVDFRERIRVDGAFIEEEFIGEFVTRYLESELGIDASFFEISTAMAFEYFTHAEVDVAVIETGLGGRFDSTNVVKPVLTVITNIGYDHKNLLGNTLTEIAYQKSGICKPGVPMIIGRRNRETDEVFIKEAALQEAELEFAQDAYTLVDDAGSNRLLHRGKVLLSHFKPELKGCYQHENFITLAATFHKIKEFFHLSVEHLKSGLEEVIGRTGLQGRYQQIQAIPRIVCDVGHNEDGLKAVFEQASRECRGVLRLILGFVSDKDVSSITHLIPERAIIYATQPSVERAMPVNVLNTYLISFNVKGQFEMVAQALFRSIEDARPEDLILVTGSTFVVADALTELKI